MKKLVFLFLLSALLTACTTADLFEKVVAIPGHQWRGNYAPQFSFRITDTVAPYRLFVVFRHSERYNYNNLWLRLGIQAPDSSRLAVAQYELPLANNEKGWLATGMGDLYEHRIALTPATGSFYFRRQGIYTFRIQQLMREDPLQEAYNIGLRVEKGR